MRRCLERDGPIGDVLREFFEVVVGYLMKNDGKGCLMANTTTELATHDEEIFKMCSANAREFEAAFTGLMARAQEKEEIAQDRSPLQLARFLVNTLNGLAVTAKATRDRKTLTDIVEVTLSTLQV